MIVYYCKDCGWRIEFEINAYIAHQCPVCLNRDIYFAQGTKEEVEVFIRELYNGKGLIS
jgi:predicted RNA-binding Zn-ribbon protein involved in translation (DUF1610 family)